MTKTWLALALALALTACGSDQRSRDPRDLASVLPDAGGDDLALAGDLGLCDTCDSVCAAQEMTCFADAGCLAYDDCIGACAVGDLDCLAGCATAPSVTAAGVDLFHALERCVFNACSDCQLTSRG